MGPLVVTSGRITLPPQLEGQALTVLEVELGDKEGPFDPDRLTVGTTPVETFADLASLAGVTVVREGDALLFSTDHAGDPRWSDQAAAFWSGLGRFATGGEVQLRGGDGTTWSYRYSQDGVQQVGAPPDGPDTTAPSGRPAPEPPTAPPPVPDPGPAQEPPATSGWPPPVPPSRPPSAPSEDPSYASLFDESEPPPRSPGRTAAMAALLVVGVLLIVGVAMLTAGLL